MSGTAMIIEDTAYLRDLMAAYLDMLGYQVTEMTTADEGLQALESGQTFDIVVSDFNTQSAKTGMDVVLYCHEHGIPAVLQTAEDSQLEKLAGGEGLVGIVKGGINLEQLKAAIGRAVVVAGGPARDAETAPTYDGPQ